MPLSPKEVLTRQADLLYRCESKPKFLGAIGGAASMDFGFKAEAEGKQPFLDFVENWGMSFTNAIRTALAFQVTEDMCAMLEVAAAQLDISDQFHRQLAPHGSGLVLFDKPIPLQDVRGETMLVHWLAWGPTMTDKGPAILMAGFNDYGLDRDQVWHYLGGTSEEVTPEQFKEAQDTLGNWGYCGSYALYDHQRMGPAMIDSSAETAAKVAEEGLEPQPSTNMLRYVHALWLLLGQTITSTRQEEPDRATRRRMGRMKLPPAVTVISLRRRESSFDRPEGESMIEWQHRWVVRGHWRWQPYGNRSKAHEGDHRLVSGVMAGESFYGSTSHYSENLSNVRVCEHEGCQYREERIYINAYVKGPEDAPFVQSEKLYRLSQ